MCIDEARKNVESDELKGELNIEFSNLSVKLKTKENKLKDFTNQTGLKRDKFREQVFANETGKGYGKSVSAKAVWENKKELERTHYIQKIKPTLSKVTESADTVLQSKLDYDIIYKGKSKQGIIPKGVTLTDVRIIAGYGSSANIRVAKDLVRAHGGVDWKWQKKTGICHSKYGRYEIHWYEYNSKQTEAKLKGYKDL